MTKTTMILGCVSASPMLWAIGLGIMNQPRKLTIAEPVKTELAIEENKPLTFEAPIAAEVRHFVLATTVIVATIAKPKVVAEEEKPYGCGEWRASLIGGTVRTCE